MKQNWKRCLPLLSTLLPVALGAAMPWLASAFQDARMGNSQESLELNMVSLTLLQDNRLEQTLRIASSGPVTIPWEGGTALTEDEALQAAEEAWDMMYSFNMVSKWERSMLSKGERTAEPRLMVAGDGSSALVWDCRWADEDWNWSAAMAVDDVSGKAVQIDVGSPVEMNNMVISSAGTDGKHVVYRENYYVQVDMWVQFLEYYYNANLMTVTELGDISEGEMQFLLSLKFLYNEENVQTLSLPLELYYDRTRMRFNF